MLSSATKSSIVFILFLTSLIAAFLPVAHAQQQATTQSASGNKQYHLNKIFSSNSAFGPLNSTHSLASSDELLLFWSEPPSDAEPGSGAPDAYHFQIMSFLQGQPSLPADQRLKEEGSLSGHNATAAIDGNKHSVVLAADMNSDGYAEVASVWEAADHKVFASVQSVDKSNLTFENNDVSGESVGTLPSGSSDYDGQIRARLADLLGDGNKELVIAWHDVSDGNIHIAVYKYSSSAASHLSSFTQISDMPVETDSDHEALFALTTGDFNQDGDNEIALAGFKTDGSLYIKLYDLDKNNALVAKGEKDFSAYNSGSVSQLAMATGDFNGDAYDEIALALTSAGLSSDDPNSIIYIAQPYPTLDNVSVSTDSSAVKYAIETSQNLPAASLDCGDLNGDGKDEIVLGAMNHVLVFDAQANGRYLQPVFKYKTEVDGGGDPEDYKYSGSFLKVGDVDQDRKAEIVVLRNEYNNGGMNAYQALDVTVLGVNEDNTGLDVKATKTSYQSETTSGNTDFRRHYALAVGDFNGDGLRLGQPTHFVKTKIVQPLVILNAPPVHFDVLDGKSYDINGCFNGKDCNFSATYNHTAKDKDIMETRVNSSWGMDASLSGEVGTLTTKVSASLDTHYGRDFSNIHNSSEENTVTINVDAIQDDQIYAIVSDYDLWEYPVYDGDKMKGHVLVTVPKITEAQWFASNSWTAYSYIPDHEVGNILSYRAYAELNNNPYLLQKVKGLLTDPDKVNSFLLSATSSYSWGLAFADFSSNKADESQDYSLRVGVSIEYGKEFGGIGASIKASVSGDYSNSHLDSHTSTVTDALALTATMGGIDRSLGEDEYIITPYAYWSTNGALVIDYAARPSLAPAGGTETWWQQEYGHAPDPALTLPFRLYPEKGYPLQDPAKKYQTKEIVFDPSNPAPGDQVTTTVRIHNYSLLPTNGPVSVSFYIGDPAKGGKLIKDASGDSVFSTDSFIGARESKLVSFTWAAPAAVDSRFLYQGDFTRVYAVIDPQNKIKEIHEDNNEGWSILEIPGVAAPIEKEAGNGLPSVVKLYPAYPNPFNPTTTLHYYLPEAANVRLTIYNILGRKVRDLVDARQSAGNHSIQFNAEHLASGTYFYQLHAGATVKTGKLMLIK